MTDAAPAPVPVAPLSSAPAAVPIASGVAIETHIAGMSRDAVTAQLESNRKNPDFAKRFGNGDTAARAEMDLLFKRMAQLDGASGGVATEQAQAAKNDPAAAMDDAMTTAPASPAAYDLGPIEGEITKEVQAADTMLRSFLHDAKVPRAIGDSVAKAASQAIRGYKQQHPDGWPGMGDGQRAAHGVNTEAQLRQVWGDKFDANLRSAKELTVELDEKHKGRVVAYLEHTGLGSDPRVILAIQQHAERLLARNERRAAKK
jgi:hypothetical protein